MKTKLNGSRLRKGFTLIELLVVILIIAILAALIVPRVIGKTSQAKTAAAQADLSTLSSAINNFRLDCDRYPTTAEGLQALVVAPSDCPGWKGPYIGSKSLPQDPWHNEYHYEYPGSEGDQSFTLLSYGSDGAPGGEGEAADISSNG